MNLDRLTRHHHLLLLQGPVGPFFWKLRYYLTKQGVKVSKVNFNGGDRLFYPRHAHVWKDRPTGLEAFYAEVIDSEKIDALVLFGEFRPVHRPAIHLAKQRRLPVYVFEEGYLRPHFITLERLGEAMPDPAEYQELPAKPMPEPLPVASLWMTAWWAFLYYAALTFTATRFPNYLHHRCSSGVTEGLRWLRAFWRKGRDAWRGDSRHIVGHCATTWSNRFFLVPLQVHNDSQVVHRSRYRNVRRFLLEVLRSFAENSETGYHLVIKHHPLDVGARNYSRLIDAAVDRLGLHGRVHYILGGHLPTLLTHARGVVTINSTAGISALQHRTPVKTLGQAIYDLPGLVDQQPLQGFWKQPAPVDIKRFLRFRRVLYEFSQLNGSFYNRMPLFEQENSTFPRPS
jgi:capsular polysaccharide export protein